MVAHGAGRVKSPIGLASVGKVPPIGALTPARLDDLFLVDTVCRDFGDVEGEDSSALNNFAVDVPIAVRASFDSTGQL